MISYPSDITFVMGAPKDSSHCDGSFEYPQHMFWLKSKIIFKSMLIWCSHLIMLCLGSSDSLCYK